MRGQLAHANMGPCWGMAGWMADGGWRTATEPVSIVAMTCPTVTVSSSLICVHDKP